MKKLLLSTILFSLIYLSIIQIAKASCQPIYGGGQTCTKEQSSAKSTAAPIVNKTKGGFPVLPSSSVKTTPATGPEMFPLIGLIPMGLAGIFLRKKA